jgi:hypothetical protein
MATTMYLLLKLTNFTAKEGPGGRLIICRSS